MLASITALFCAIPLAQDGPIPQDWVIQSGQSFNYDTSLGPLHLNSLTVQVGGFLRVLGPQPFVLVADSFIQIDGTVDAGGIDAKQVGTLFTPTQPEIGAIGGPGGGQGGTGSPETTGSSKKGGGGSVGFPSAAGILRGGQGGETGFSPSGDKEQRRGAGGGGGAFGPDEPPLVAEAGSDGHPAGTGACTLTSPPKGGQPNQIPFQDGNPLNDFWGRKLDPASGSVIHGELKTPRAGYGGGAGGDAIQSSTFPTIPFGPPFIDKKGAGAGGGGGLLVFVTPVITVGSLGELRVDGGDGATGENVIAFDHIAGSSGGGSGGMMILQAELIDLSQASADALTAIGGEGGIGSTSGILGLSKGGNGGPGLVQLHTRNPANVLLRVGSTLDDLTAPNGHVLLPEL